MWGCGGRILLFNPTVRAGSGGRGGTRTGTHTHTEERTHECCTYPLATYPVKSAPKRGGKENVKNWYLSFLGPKLGESSRKTLRFQGNFQIRIRYKLLKSGKKAERLTLGPETIPWGEGFSTRRVRGLKGSFPLPKPMENKSFL